MDEFKKAVFLDRDGVINKVVIKNGTPHPPPDLNHFEVLPGVPKALEILSNAGFILIIVTNQPDVARGSMSKAVVENINNYILDSFPITEIFSCYHDSGDRCNCRKPKPGALITAAKKYNISLTQSFMIGDRWRDIDAGNAAQCKTIFLDYNYNEKLISKPDQTSYSLIDAANWINEVAGS